MSRSIRGRKGNRMETMILGRWSERESREEEILEQNFWVDLRIKVATRLQISRWRWLGPGA